MASALASGVFEGIKLFFVDATGLDDVLGAELTDRCSEEVAFLLVTEGLTEEFLTDGVLGATAVSDCLSLDEFDTDVSRWGVADFAPALEDFPGVSFRV